MGPVSHLAVSLSAGATAGILTKSLYVGGVCFISGIFLDFDHIIEYIIHQGWKGFSPWKVYQACKQTTRQEGEERFPKLYLIFHSIEAAILLWIEALYIKNVYLSALAFGYSIHMAMDSIANPMYVHSYFIFWRLIKGFDANQLFRRKSYFQDKLQL